MHKSREDASSEKASEFLAMLADEGPPLYKANLERLGEVVAVSSAQITAKNNRAHEEIGKHSPSKGIK